jgi:hypothetical protein
MKNGKLFALMIVALIAFSSCEKCMPEECDLVPAKIIRYDCDRVIFQLLTTTLIGDPDWEDVQTGQRYSNVVSYHNNCKIDELTNGEKITLYVNFKEPDFNMVIGDCYRCQAISEAPPQTKVVFETISKSPCEAATAQ